MKTYIEKTIDTDPKVISIKNKTDKVEIKAQRYRNTEGGAGITIWCGNQHMTFTKANLGDEYEFIAKEVSDVLDEICQDYCSIKEIE